MADRRDTEPREGVLPASRRWVASRAKGATLEVGVGSWPSLGFYPRDVQLTGLDLRASAVAKAARTLARAGRRADLVKGDAMELPFGDATFDTVVFSFSLCGVPQVQGALIEAMRVLKPGGSLLMADHIGADSGPMRLLQRVAETFTAPLVGEHFTRRPALDAVALDVDIVARERVGRGGIERLHAVKRG